MNKQLLFFLLFTSTAIFSQEERIVIKGQITGVNIETSNIHIVNKTTKKGSISNAKDLFEIEGKIGDSLYISAIHIQNKIIAITLKNYNTKKITIAVSENSNTIKEVLIKNHNLTGILLIDVKKSPNKDSLLLKNGALEYAVAYDLRKPMKPDALSNEKRLIRSLGNVDPTRTPSVNVLGGIGLVIDLFTNKEKQKERKRIHRKMKIKQENIAVLKQKDNLEKELTALYGTNFFTKELQIPKLKISDFITYCQEKKDVALLLVNKKELSLISFLLQESKNYKQLLKEE